MRFWRFTGFTMLAASMAAGLGQDFAAASTCMVAGITCLSTADIIRLLERRP